MTPAKDLEGQVTEGLLPMLQATAALAMEAPGARPHTQRLMSSWPAVEVVGADAQLMLASDLYLAGTHCGCQPKAPAEFVVGTSAHEARGAATQLAGMLSSTAGGVAVGLQYQYA